MHSVGSDMVIRLKVYYPSGGETQQHLQELSHTQPSTLWHLNSTRNCWRLRSLVHQPLTGNTYLLFKCVNIFCLCQPSYKSCYSRFVAGSMAGSTGQMLTYPLDRARAVMAVTNSNGKQYKNLIVVFRSIIRDEGLLSLYRGLTPTLLGVIPYAGTSFFTYETLKGWTVQRRGNEEHTHWMLPSPVERMACGAIAGFLGQASSYPLDIVR